MSDEMRERAAYEVVGDAFDCKMCGHCCKGEGGIIMSRFDQERLAAHLEMSVEVMIERYGEDRNGKACLRVGDDGYCIFFRQGEGCGVHLAKPNICRAWPFFRGNIVDSMSWEMAQDFCPGINPESSHAEFVRQGMDYLREQGLLEKEDDRDHVAGALCVDSKP